MENTYRYSYPECLFTNKIIVHLSWTADFIEH